MYGWNIRDLSLNVLYVLQQLLTGKVRVPLPPEGAEPAPSAEPTGATATKPVTESNAEASA